MEKEKDKAKQKAKVSVAENSLTKEIILQTYATRQLVDVLRVLVAEMKSNRTKIIVKETK